MTERPGPQPMNAGITSGYSAAGTPVVEADSFPERLRKVEGTIDRMRTWAEAAQAKMVKQDTLIRMLVEDVRRLQNQAADVGVAAQQGAKK